MARVHAVDTVELDVLWRNPENILYRLFGVDHVVHQLLESTVLGKLIHLRGVGEPFC